MMARARSPYECFKSDRERLYALISRDLRIVAVAAICTGATSVAAPILVRAVARWIA